jgi:multiple sugar transport system substrate-binding protein
MPDQPDYSQPNLKKDFPFEPPPQPGPPKIEASPAPPARPEPIRGELPVTPPTTELKSPPPVYPEPSREEPTKPVSPDFQPPSPEPSVISSPDVPLPTPPPTEPLTSTLTPPEAIPPEEAATALVSEEPGGKGINIKKFLPFVLVLIVFIALIGVGYKLILPRLMKTTSQEVTLTYWGLWEPETIYSSVINEYQQSHPKVKIEYVQHSPKDYRQRLQSALAREEGPDIFRFHNTWVPMLKRDLAPIPATIMDSATFEANYYPVMRQDLRINNNYSGIPLEIDGLGLFINEEIFERGGKTIPSSVTWDEFRQLACELTSINEQDQVEISGAALGRTENVEHWSDILGLMIMQNAGDPKDPAADLVNPASKRAQDSIKYFAMFNQKTTDCSRTWDETLPSSTQAFAGGMVAMYFGPSWEVFEIKKIDPNLRFRVIPVPQLPGTNLTWASYWVEGINQNSKNQEAAWEFLKYMSEKTTTQKLFEAQSKLRLFGEPYSRTDMANLLEGDLFAGAYIRQATAARSWYLASRTFDNGLNDSMIEAFQVVVDLAGEGKDVEKDLETLAQKVGQFLSQYEVSAAVVR